MLLFFYGFFWLFIFFFHSKIKEMVPGVRNSTCSLGDEDSNFCQTTERNGKTMCAYACVSEGTWLVCVLVSVRDSKNAEC